MRRGWLIDARGAEGRADPPPSRQAAVAAALAAVDDPAVRCAVLDALSEQDTDPGVALREIKLDLGGSGLAIGLARLAQRSRAGRASPASAGRPGGGALGPCGNDRQVAAYGQPGPAGAVDLSACFTNLESCVRTLAHRVDAQRDALARVISATTGRKRCSGSGAAGDKASSERVEQLLPPCRRPEGERIYRLSWPGSAALWRRTAGWAFISADHLPGVPSGT